MILNNLLILVISFVIPIKYVTSKLMIYVMKIFKRATIIVSLSTLMTYPFFYMVFL